MAALIIVLATGCGDASAGSGSSTPTARTTGTPTTGSQYGRVILGGDIRAFEQRLGRPNDHTDTASGFFHFQRVPGSNEDHFIIVTDILDGQAYLSRVIDVTIQSLPNVPWTMLDARTYCIHFAPPDASFTKEVQLRDSTNTLIGIDDIYFSPSLAQGFPARAFIDNSSNPVRPGMFEIGYLYGLDAQSNPNPQVADSCELGLGDTQATAPY